MAKASIAIKSIEPKATYFLVTFQYKHKSGYSVHDDSVRMYYSLDAEIEHGTPYIVLDVNHPEDDPNILSWTTVNGYYQMVCRVPGTNDTPLVTDTTYWLRPFLQLYTSGGKKYKKYRGPGGNPISETTGVAGPSQKLFCIAEYSNPHEGEDGDTEYDTTWVDFTSNIVMSTYDVNYEDVTEDWEDADYVTHRIIPRTRIKGSLEMYFFSKYEYNNFIRLLQINRKVNNELGNGYVQLKLQVNNNLDPAVDIFSTTDLGDRRCARDIGMFFITMESNPWNVPMFGHYDKIEPLRLEIVEA